MNSGGIYNSTKINEKSSLVFGYLTESQSRVYSQVIPWKTEAFTKPNASDISIADSEFVSKYQDTSGSLGSELAREDKGFPFSIANDFGVKLAFMVRESCKRKNEKGIL